jgi:hypothetical protein
MRAFYATDVVGRVMAQHVANPTHNYKQVEGGIPIPATLSIELGRLISARNARTGRLATSAASRKSLSISRSARTSCRSSTYWPISHWRARSASPSSRCSAARPRSSAR